MKVKVHYLFSKNKKIGSKFISWGTKHLHNTENTPSHVAILIKGRWVLESTALNGVRIITYKKWLKINEEVAKVPYSKKGIDYSNIKKIFKTIQNKKYDWLGVSYFAWWMALNKFFNIPIPKENKWSNSNRYFCTEAVGKLSGQNYEMKTPVDIMNDLKSLDQDD